MTAANDSRKRRQQTTGNHMTRNEWLSTLKFGDPVLLRTQLRTYDAVVDRDDGERLWILFALNDTLSSAVWVSPKTGANAITNVSIHPRPPLDAHDAQEGVKTGEFGALRDYPLPWHSQDGSAPKIEVFGDDERDANPN